MTDSALTEHISICCTKATRQLNALSWTSRYLDISSCSFLFNSVVKSNFNYCPLVWHFCGKVNYEKIEKIQHRVLRIIYKDHVSSYDDLMSKAHAPTMLNRRLHGILCEVFKCIVCRHNRWWFLYIQIISKKYRWHDHKGHWFSVLVMNIFNFI